MQSGWFRNQLTPSKRLSEMYSSLADIIQDIFEVAVEPILSRISARKSFFTMADEDLDTRIAEMGKFFTIRVSDASSKPMLLQQRLDEIHFKGTSQPITQTFYREFNGIPITWQPLYAPVDLEKYPYCTQLIAENNLESIGAAFGELFLTSRGVISVSIIDLQKLILIYGEAKTTEELTEIALAKFKQVVQPLLPLHIVFDDMQLMLKLQVDEAREIAWHAYATSEATYAGSEHVDVPVLTSIGSEMTPLLAESTSSVPGGIRRFDRTGHDGAILDEHYGLDFEVPDTNVRSKIRDIEDSGHHVSIDVVPEKWTAEEGGDGVAIEQQIQLSGVAEGKAIDPDWADITPVYDRTTHDGHVLDTTPDELTEED
ncbi:phage tail protein [Pseudocitrobacter sp. RIT415]|uniref:phage tail protein n=1 Tax=Pseudocitrobacter sp. RIT415 TaxID=2202163 RepID=UPI000D3842EB|nr:phage tail protein [Pseudocitrobacter sp. RIT 415]RAU45272.1 phage tail protein [Pseudocitrobacter sp. RIT 415]